MRCSKCGGKMTVKYTWNVDGGDVLRWQQCQNCGKMIYTMESPIDYCLGLELKSAANAVKKEEFKRRKAK